MDSFIYWFVYNYYYLFLIEFCMFYFCVPYILLADVTELRWVSQAYQPAGALTIAAEHQATSGRLVSSSHRQTEGYCWNPVAAPTIARALVPEMYNLTRSILRHHRFVTRCLRIVMHSTLASHILLIMTSARQLCRIRVRMMTAHVRAGLSKRTLGKSAEPVHGARTQKGL